MVRILKGYDEDPIRSVNKSNPVIKFTVLIHDFHYVFYPCRGK
jgi:hypothetical protein